MNSTALLGSDSYAITTVCPHIAIQVFHEAGAFSSPRTPAPLCGESWEGPLESRGGGCDGERAWGLGRILREVLRPALAYGLAVLCPQRPLYLPRDLGLTTPVGK